MDHTRHSAIFLVPSWYRVVLIGAGGIGAISALALAKMGVQIMDVYDDDVVSGENIATQLHQVSQIGLPKGTALRETLSLFSDDMHMYTFNERITALSDVGEPDLIISAVDSINARKEIWEMVKSRKNTPWYLDARMAAEQYQHYLVKLNSVTAYELELSRLSEEDIEEVPCTEKSTFYTAGIAAGQIGTALRNILRGEAVSHRLVHYIPQGRINMFKL